MTVTETVSPATSAPILAAPAATAAHSPTATDAEVLEERAALTGTALTDSAAELLNAMASLPQGHSARVTLRDRAIEAWLPLARHLAHRYSGRGEPTDDLVQTATVGLIKAVDKFDPERGVDFAGYAIPTIIGEIKRHFRDRTWSVRVPRRLQELRLAITEANSTLTHSLGRSPTVADVAGHLGISEEDVLEGLEGARLVPPNQQLCIRVAKEAANISSRERDASHVQRQQHRLSGRKMGPLRLVVSRPHRTVLL